MQNTDFFLVFFCQVSEHKAYQLQVTQDHITLKMSYVFISDRITLLTSCSSSFTQSVLSSYKFQK